MSGSGRLKKGLIAAATASLQVTKGSSGKVPTPADELKEEAGVEGSNPISIAVHGEPTRDPRKHVIALFYLVDVDPESIPTAGDDASEAYWVPLDAVTENEIAGDHILIIDKLRE